jgi:hypothetical protein
MAQLNKIQLPTYTEGQIDPGAIDEIVAPVNSVSLAVNVNFDRIGAVQTRDGITAIGNAIVDSTPILGLHNYINNIGTTYRLLAKVGSAVYDYDGSSWTSRRTGLTASSKARFTTLVDYTFMVNGNSNQAVQSYNGSAFGDTNVASLPAGDIIENFRSRIWVANSSNDKLYYSDVVDTDNTISGGSSFIQISPQDGDKITGLKRSPNALLVFKQNHIYKVYSINSTDPDPYINIGTYSHESIIDAKSGIYFHSPSGFYQYASIPIEISKRISDVVKAIPRASWDDICGWSDGDYLYWSIGDITLNGISLSNIICRYTISKELWTLYSYPTQMRSASKYDDGTNFYNVIGGELGKVYKFNEGNDDDGTPIFYDLQTQFYYITSSKSDLKTIQKIATMFENAQGAQISYKIDTNSTHTWKPIGKISKELSQTFPLNANNFTRIKFRLHGNNIGDPLILRGFELLTSNAYNK